MIQSAINELVEKLLNNSQLTVSDSYSINLSDGSIFGIGDSNKDREIEMPKYILFTLTKSNLIGSKSHLFLQSSLTRSWSLKSFDSFQKLENHILIYPSDYIAVLIDGEAMEFDIIIEKEDDIWTPVINRITWSKQIYRLNYKADQVQFEKFFNNKLLLEYHLIEQVKKGADCIRAFNTIDNKHLGFRVVSDVYISGGKTELTEKNTYIVWDNPHYEECSTEDYE